MLLNQVISSALLLSLAAAPAAALNHGHGQAVLDDAPRRPCGFKIAPCPTTQTCSRIDPHCTRGENCAGYCVPRPTHTSTSSKKPKPTKTYRNCGGHRVTPAPCPSGQICVDDPFGDGCGLACDEPGICVNRCGGFAGFRCPTDMKCIDRAGDGCDPRKGGADCIGICVWK